MDSHEHGILMKQARELVHLVAIPCAGKARGQLIRDIRFAHLDSCLSLAPADRGRGLARRPQVRAYSRWRQPRPFESCSYHAMCPYTWSGITAAFYEQYLGLKRSDAGPPHAVVFDTKPIAFAVRDVVAGVDLDAIAQPGQGMALWLHASDAQDIHDALAAAGTAIISAAVDRRCRLFASLTAGHHELDACRSKVRSQPTVASWPPTFQSLAGGAVPARLPPIRATAARASPARPARLRASRGRSSASAHDRETRRSR